MAYAEGEVIHVLAPRRTREMRRDNEGNIHRVVWLYGVAGFEIHWTDSCSGCFEFGEYDQEAERLTFPLAGRPRAHDNAASAGAASRRPVGRSF